MRILVTGASGNLGGYLLQTLAGTSEHVTAWSGVRTGQLFGMPLQPVPLTEQDTLVQAFRAVRPEIVLHAAALSSMAECARTPERAHAVNTGSTILIAELAAEAKARLLYVSTDLVFDGVKGNYREDDTPAPLSVYGRTKQAGEQAVLATPRAVGARVSLLFGPSVAGRPAFFDDQLRRLRGGERLNCFADEWRTPLSLLDAAQALIALAQSDFTRLLHLGGPERLSRIEMEQRLAAYLGANPQLLVATSRTAAEGEPRPRDTSLNASRWRTLFPGLLWRDFEKALRAMKVKRGEA